MDPTATSATTLALSGGSLTSHGLPVVNMTGGGGSTARFVRRKTYASDGLTYTPQFSADLVTWQNSTDTPTTVASDATHDVVEVPFPTLLTGGQAGFFRIAISTSP
jgi:hypothetical protein